MSLEKYSARKVGDRVFEAIEHLVAIKRLSEVLVEEASTDTQYTEERVLDVVSGLEALLADIDNDTQSVKNAIVALAKDLTDTDTDEFDVEVTPDENGFKF